MSVHAAFRDNYAMHFERAVTARRYEAGVLSLFDRDGKLVALVSTANLLYLEFEEDDDA